MARADDLRAYWDEIIPDAQSFFLSDIARILRRLAGEGEPLMSLRTLRRKVERGELYAMGGSDRASVPYRVLRADLVDFLVAQDVIVGRTLPRRPPPLPPAETIGGRRRGKKKRKKKAPAQAGRPPKHRQLSFFDE